MSNIKLQTTYLVNIVQHKLSPKYGITTLYVNQQIQYKISQINLTKYEWQPNIQIIYTTFETSLFLIYIINLIAQLILSNKDRILMLVERANMFLCRSSFKTIHDIVERLVPQCPDCYSKMKYFCVDDCCKYSQPVCFSCSKAQQHNHFLHNLNRVELLHLDKDYLPRQVDAFKKKHQEVKEVVESNRTAYLEVIQQYTHYVRQLEEYMEGLEESLNKSIKSTQVFIGLDSILKQLLNCTINMTGNTRKQYWKLLSSMKLKEVKYDLLPDRYAVLSINRIRKEIEGIIQKYSSLTFEEILKKNHMNSVFQYDQINRSFITNVFGNLEDRTLRTCDQEVDPQVVKNLNKLIVDSMGYFDQEDLPHSIKQLQYDNFDCSEHIIFPEKIQSLTLRIRFNSYSTFKFNNYYLKQLKRLRIFKQNFCINTSIQYDHIKKYKNLKSLQIYDQGLTEEVKLFLYKLGIENKMRVIRILPDNVRNLQLAHFKHKKALLFAQKFSRTEIQYLDIKIRKNLLERILQI